MMPEKLQRQLPRAATTFNIRLPCYKIMKYISRCSSSNIQHPLTMLQNLELHLQVQQQKQQQQQHRLTMLQNFEVHLQVQQQQSANSILSISKVLPECSISPLGCRWCRQFENKNILRNQRLAYGFTAFSSAMMEVIDDDASLVETLVMILIIL